MRDLNIFVIDSTMRDGEQQPMLCFRDDEKISLAYQLVDLGVLEIDLMPSIDEHERILIRLLTDTPIGNHIGVSTMVGRKFVDQAIEVNARVAYCFVHISDKLMAARGKTRERNLLEIRDVIQYGRACGLIVDFCGGDGTRADSGYLRELLIEIGPLIRFYQTCDTSGLMTPDTSAKHTEELVKTLGEGRVVVHYHNDNGQSVESVIAALHSGAIGFDGTFTGIGERAGNVATEKVLECLRAQYGEYVRGIRYDRIQDVVDTVRKMCRGVQPPPVNMERSYPNVSGIHARALLGDRVAFDLNYEPAVIETMLYFGKHSGKSNYRLLFGQEKTEAECVFIRDQVKRLARELLCDFTAGQIRKMFGGRAGHAGAVGA